MDLLLPNGTPDYALLEERLHFVCRWRIAEGWSLVPDDGRLSDSPSADKQCCPLGAALYIDDIRSEMVWVGTHPAGDDTARAIEWLLDDDVDADSLEAIQQFAGEFACGFDGAVRHAPQDQEAYEMGKRFRAEYLGADE